MKTKAFLLTIIILLAISPVYALLINEIELNPEGINENEWIELYNEGIIPLTNYYIENSAGKIIKLNEDVSEYRTIAVSNFFINSNEKIFLKNNEGQIIDETPILSDSGDNYKTWSRCPGFSNGWFLGPPTFGETNICPDSGEGDGGGALIPVIIKDILFEKDEEAGELHARLTIKANKDVEDVRIRAWIDGENEPSDTTSRFDVIEGRNYLQTLTLIFPLKNIPQEFILNVRIESRELGKILERIFRISFPDSPNFNFCKVGETRRDLRISNINIDNSADDDEEWEFLNNIEIEVDIENVDEDDINDIIVELGLFDPKGRNQVGDLEFKNVDEEKVNLGTIKAKDKETAIFLFRIPSDIELGNYKLVIKTYSDDWGEVNQCTSISDDLDNNSFQIINIDREEDEGKFIAFDNIRLVPSPATCGDNIKLIADMYNIGDFNQDRIKVKLTSPELNLNLEQEILEDLDQGDKNIITFEFVIPRNLENKDYVLGLEAEYDYRNSSYREVSDESTKFTLKIEECSPLPFFIRGDSNIDGKVDISDSINTLSWLSFEEGKIMCQDAADANDDGKIDITDSLYTLNFLFNGGLSISEPYPALGIDTTLDILTCEFYPVQAMGGGGSIDKVKDAINEAKSSGMNNEIKSFFVSYLDSIPKGTLSISSYPSYAYTYVDNVYKGIAPISITNLAPGNYNVKLVKPGYATYSKTVSIQSGKVTTVSALLAQTSPNPYPSPSPQLFYYKN
ncbi:MAG: putative S-layer protein [Nanoarchaeota archaeon]